MFVSYLSQILYLRDLNICFKTFLKTNKLELSSVEFYLFLSLLKVEADGQMKKQEPV